jgi:hypothetical protein
MLHLGGKENADTQGQANCAMSVGCGFQCTTTAAEIIGGTLSQWSLCLIAGCWVSKKNARLMALNCDLIRSRGLNLLVRVKPMGFKMVLVQALRLREVRVVNLMRGHCCNHTRKKYQARAALPSCLPLGTLPWSTWGQLMVHHMGTRGEERD